MITIDTTVLARVLMKDNPDEARAAETLLSSNQCYVPLSVVLELAWVLKSVYRQERKNQIAALRSVLAADRLEVERADAVAMALDWTEEGLDFADALHLASSPPADRFATFDRAFVRLAARLHTAIPVSAP